MKKLSPTLLAIATLAVFSIVPAVYAEDGGDASPTPTASSTSTPHPTTGKDAKRKSEDALRRQEAEDAFSKLSGDMDKKLNGCRVVETKVKAREDNDSRLEGAHTEQYTKLVTTITDLISRAQTAGYDTTVLQSELLTLKDKIATFTTDRDTYLAAIKASLTAACGKTEGDFKDAIVGARADLAAMHADVQAIHDYVTSTIKPTVKALKKQVQATATETPEPTTSPSAN